MSYPSSRSHFSTSAACVLFTQFLNFCIAASIPTAIPITARNECDLHIKDEELSLKCASLTNQFSITDGISNLNLQWDDFRSNSLQNATFHSIVIANSTLNSFQTAFDFPPVQRLHQLSLENVTFTHRPRWEDLNQLHNLRVFSVYNTTLPTSIDSSFGRNVGLALQSLTITESNITDIKADSFTELKILTYLRISHNNLKSFPKLILPTQSKLEELRLDYNCIHSLDTEVFTDLPKLKVLSLSSNRISSLPENVFSSIWNSTVYIDLRDNPIKCDCRLHWTITSPSKPGNLIGQCAFPKRLFGKNLKDLTIEDLAC